MQLSKFLIAASFAAVSTAPQAQQLDITIYNQTHGITFTPLLVAGHDMNTHIFQTGQPASPELQIQAEGGDPSGVAGLLMTAGAVLNVNPAGGLFMPGASTNLTMDTGNFSYLSLTAMLLPTNDGFAGVDAWNIPTAPGVYWINVNAYDAGTEANDEIINGGGPPGVPGIPLDPLMNGGVNGTGVTTQETNTNIHIHRGNLGDSDPMGGNSDVDNRVHRWLNPVLRVRVEVL